MSYKLFINAIRCQIWSAKCSPISSMSSTARQFFSMSGTNFKSHSRDASKFAGEARLMPIRPHNISTSRLLQSSAQNSAKEQIIFINNNRYYLISTYGLVLLAVPMAAYNIYLLSSEKDPNKLSPDQISVPFVLFSSLLVLMAFASVRFMLSRTFLRITFNESSRQFIGVQCNWRLGNERVIFGPGDVKPAGDQSSSWSEFFGNLSINGKPYYLPLADFKSTYHYNLMLGLVK